MELPIPSKADLASVSCLGLPRALLYWRYGTFWERFFQELGVPTKVSPPTDKAILDAGSALSIDECCLASKAYMGHVAALAGECDAVFAPSYGSAAPHAGFCTKFQGLTDLTANTFRDSSCQVVGLLVEDARDKRSCERAWVELGQRFGASAKEAKRACSVALGAQEAQERQRAARMEARLRSVEAARQEADRKGGRPDELPLAILLVAHPYLSHDPYLCGTIVEAFEGMGAAVLFADEAPHGPAYKKSFEFSRTLPWLVNRELIGALLALRQRVDGIVLVSAFPCGPDSMTDDAILRCVKGTPVLNLMIDAQSGTAGAETRVESFVDILRYQKAGGYLG